MNIKKRRITQLGQGLVEYGLIVGLIAIIVIAVIVALGPQIREVWSPEKSYEDYPADAPFGKPITEKPAAAPAAPPAVTPPAADPTE